MSLKYLDLVKLSDEELAEVFAKSKHLEDEIREKLGAIGYEF